MNDNRKEISDEQANSWRLFGKLMAVPVFLVLIVAYGISSNAAVRWSSWLVSATNFDFLSSLLVTFSNYSSPHNALLAVLASWLTSPLSSGAGYVFTGRIIAENIENHAPSSRWRLIMRMLVILFLLLVSLYAVLMLAGSSSVFCRGCEQNSMAFMLTVSIVGFWCVGALLGIEKTLLKILFN